MKRKIKYIVSLHFIPNVKIDLLKSILRKVERDEGILGARETVKSSQSSPFVQWD